MRVGVLKFGDAFQRSLRFREIQSAKPTAALRQPQCALVRDLHTAFEIHVYKPSAGLCDSVQAFV